MYALPESDSRGASIFAAEIMVIKHARITAKEKFYCNALILSGSKSVLLAINDKMSSKDTVLRALEIHIELVREENIIVQYALWILCPTLETE